MITLKELNKNNYPTTSEIDQNLATLLSKMNVVRDKYTKPMIVTSGLRSEQKQSQLIADGKSTAKKSNHLIGAAIDIYDPDGNLWKWCMVHMDVLTEIGLWLEDKKSTPTWVHFQIFPPKSGKRIFIP